MKKRYLLAPGPTPVPERVLLAMAMPILHHRSPEFEPIFQEVRDGLKWIFQTANEVLLFASSGTGAMEGAVTNLLSRGDEAICVRGGKFGERWAEICKAYGVVAHNIDVTWGEAVDPAAVREALKKHPKTKAVYFQACETSTGVGHPVKEIAATVRENSDALIICDGITGIGVNDLPVDDWGIDVAVAGSQKAFMLPPGLAFASVSARAWKSAETADLPKYYFNWKTEHGAHLKNQSAWTPAVSLMIGLREALRMMKEETLPAMFERHARLAEATRAGAQALGLELFAPKSPATALTAIKGPEGIDTGKITKTLRDQLGVTIAGGQSQLKGKIFRISHFGYVTRFDVLTGLVALEIALQSLGYPVKLGEGVKAAEERLGL
ncbi:MAG: alanine--glyoxylate aminotransferase family protein [Deltaproteobacteria bacterium]|nr:alanine--glyoxylate aminotransferase family protein [Deltaproteobacteria bacterium]